MQPVVPVVPTNIESTLIHGSNIFGVKHERIFSTLKQNGVYEWAESAILPQFVYVGGQALDIGANIGYYTALLTVTVGASGTVHAFEANPSTFSLLQHTAEANNWTNVHLNLCAMSGEVGEISIDPGPPLDEQPEGINLGGWSLVDRPTGSVSIPATTIDSYCDEKGFTPSFVKIDVEGFESHVLRGGINTLRRRRSPLLIEFVRSKTDPGHIFELYDLIRSMGYTILKIAKRPYPHLRRLDEEELHDLQMLYALCISDSAAKAMGMGNEAVFAAQEAAQAGLLNSADAWKRYLKRMFEMRKR